MADVFLMGTSGSFDDPKRSMWREPIKAACAKAGIACYDPVVPVWNEEAGKNEAEALRKARVLVMCITSDTVGMASLAESGWAVLSAVLRRQSVGLYVDPEFKGERITDSTVSIRIDTLINRGSETVEDASRRARKLINSHANGLKAQFPMLDLYVAKSLDDLAPWTVQTVQRIRQQSS
jgi:hypothetical protein